MQAIRKSCATLYNLKPTKNKSIVAVIVVVVVGMTRCGGIALYLMAIVLLVALFASSAKCRPEPALLADDGKDSGSNGGNNAMAALNSTAASANGSSGSGGGDVKLVWCLTRSCVYEGRGNQPCFCCGATKPPACYETMDLCRGNCV